MYRAGSIIYFPRFSFKNGAASKAKYFVALKITESDIILASLPSSVDHLPRTVDQQHGCLEIPEGNINCYIFKAGRVIADNQWAFALDTYLYGWWIDDYEISKLENLYPIENIDYELKGTLTDTELTKLIACFANSSSVKRKYRRMLS